MRTQLITVNTDGSIESLDFKKKGVDLRDLGKVDIKRASLIEFCEERQQWYIKLLQDGNNYSKGDILTNGQMVKVIPQDSRMLGFRWDRISKGTLFYDDYEDAVLDEIDFIQCDRERGEVK